MFINLLLISLLVFYPFFQEKHNVQVILAEYTRVSSDDEMKVFVKKHFTGIASKDENIPGMIEWMNNFQPCLTDGYQIKEFGESDAKRYKIYWPQNGDKFDAIYAIRIQQKRKSTGCPNYIPIGLIDGKVAMFGGIAKADTQHPMVFAEKI